MGVDVIDVRWLQSCPFQRHLHAAEPAVAIFAGGSDVIGIPRQPVSQHFGVDLRAARLRVLVVLQHHHACAFAHHEAVAVCVIGARRFGRIIGPLGRQRLAGVEPGDADLADRAFRATCNHHIGVAPLDQPRRIANGMCAGRTGGHNGMVRPLEPETNRHLTGNQVDQGPRYEKGRYPLGPLLLDQHCGLRNRRQSADTRSQHDPCCAAVLFRHRFPAGIAHRLNRRRHSIQDKVIYLAAVLRLHPVIRAEGAIGPVTHRNLAGILRHNVRRIEPRDRPRAGLTRNQAFPGLLDSAGKRSDHAQTRDNHPTHENLPAPSNVGAVIHACLSARNNAPAFT